MDGRHDQRVKDAPSEPLHGARPHAGPEAVDGGRVPHGPDKEQPGGEQVDGAAAPDAGDDAGGGAADGGEHERDGGERGDGRVRLAVVRGGDGVGGEEDGLHGADEADDGEERGEVEVLAPARPVLHIKVCEQTFS